MIELKQEVNALCGRLDEPPRHELAFLDGVSEESSSPVGVQSGEGCA